MRPIFVTLIVAALFMFFIVLIPLLRRRAARLVVLRGSIILVILSAQLLYYNGMIVDKLGLRGDEMSAYIFLAVLVFSVMGSIIFYAGRKHSERSQMNPLQ